MYFSRTMLEKEKKVNLCGQLLFQFIHAKIFNGNMQVIGLVHDFLYEKRVKYWFCCVNKRKCIANINFLWFLFESRFSLLFFSRISKSPSLAERHNPPANVSINPPNTTRLNSSSVSTWLGWPRPTTSRLLSTTQLSRQSQSTRTGPVLLQTTTIMARS